MNKTNVERIKDLKYSGSFTMTNMDGPGPLVSSVQKDEFDWLIEQAERVQVLEGAVEGLAKAVEIYSEKSCEEAMKDLISMMEGEKDD